MSDTHPSVPAVTPQRAIDTCPLCGRLMLRSERACATCGAERERRQLAYLEGQLPIEGLHEAHAVDCAVEFDDPAACTCGLNKERAHG